MSEEFLKKKYAAKPIFICYDEVQQMRHEDWDKLLEWYRNYYADREKNFRKFFMTSWPDPEPLDWPEKEIDWPHKKENRELPKT